MQRKILCLCTLITMSLVAMEKESKIPLQLTHQSPEITRVHSQDYLKWLTNNRSELELAVGLKWVSQALNTTDELKLKIAPKLIGQNISAQQMYNICIVPDSFYAAGNSVPPQFGDLYAIIPIAAAHALQSGLFEKILIIDEHIDDLIDYCCKENGFIFYPYQKNKVFDLFNNKIFFQYNHTILNFSHEEYLRYIKEYYREIAQDLLNKDLKDVGFYDIDKNSQDYDQCIQTMTSLFEKEDSKKSSIEIPRRLLSINLNNSNIDLAFYNIDEDIQDYNKRVERVETITALLEKNIPTVFICSCQSIADDIENIINDIKG